MHASAEPLCPRASLGYGKLAAASGLVVRWGEQSAGSRLEVRFWRGQVMLERNGQSLENGG